MKFSLFSHHTFTELLPWLKLDPKRAVHSVYFYFLNFTLKRELLKRTGVSILSTV